MSLVTRATSAPRRSSLWSARLSRWMCSNRRTRSPYSASSLRRPRRRDGGALGDGGDDDRRPGRSGRSTVDRSRRRTSSSVRSRGRSPAGRGSARRPARRRRRSPAANVSAEALRAAPAPASHAAADRCCTRRTDRRLERLVVIGSTLARRRSARSCSNASIEPAVARATVPHQLVVRAVGDDLPVGEVQHVVGEGDGRRPRGDGDHRRAARARRAGWRAPAPRWPGRAPRWCRRAAAAPGRRTSARARATRWRCPPVRLTPRSPTIGVEPVRAGRATNSGLGGAQRRARSRRR